MPWRPYLYFCYEQSNMFIEYFLSYPIYDGISLLYNCEHKNIFVFVIKILRIVKVFVKVRLESQNL